VAWKSNGAFRVLSRYMTLSHDNNVQLLSVATETQQSVALHCCYLITPWRRVLLKKLAGYQLVKKFPAFYGNRRVHYHIHKCPSPVSILSQFDPVHTPTSHFLKIHLNIILPSTPGSPNWSLSSTFPHQYPVYASPPNVLHVPPISFFSTLPWGYNIFRTVLTTVLLGSSCTVPDIFARF